MPTGVYVRTEEHRRKLRKPKSEEGRRNISIAHKGIPNKNKGKTYEEIFGLEKAEEWKRKISEAHFKGGDYIYWHNLAWELFGIGKTCIVCGMTNEEHLLKYGCRLHMHCKSIPKNYKLMEEYNWDIVCKEHHPGLESQCDIY